jgi:hypothetical protein
MATGVKVDVTDIAIIEALNTPGGAIFAWRDKVGRDTTRIAIGLSPVNDVENAEHRGGVVGTYKASWTWDRIGSQGHTVRARVMNGSDHADIVEYGRRRSLAREVFSWTGHDPSGSISAHFAGTSGRDGQHVLARAASFAVGTATGGSGFEMTVSEPGEG